MKWDIRSFWRFAADKISFIYFLAPKKKEWVTATALNKEVSEETKLNGEELLLLSFLFKPSFDMCGMDYVNIFRSIWSKKTFFSLSYPVEAIVVCLLPLWWIKAKRSTKQAATSVCHFKLWWFFKMHMKCFYVNNSKQIWKNYRAWLSTSFSGQFPLFLFIFQIQISIFILHFIE